jgi:hypothetical protein
MKNTLACKFKISRRIGSRYGKRGMEKLELKEFVVFNKNQRQSWKTRWHVRQKMQLRKSNPIFLFFLFFKFFNFLIFFFESIFIILKNCFRSRPDFYYYFIIFFFALKVYPIFFCFKSRPDFFSFHFLVKLFECLAGKNCSWRRFNKVIKDIFRANSFFSRGSLKLIFVTVQWLKITRRRPSSWLKHVALI